MLPKFLHSFYDLQNKVKVSHCKPFKVFVGLYLKVAPLQEERLGRVDVLMEQGRSRGGVDVLMEQGRSRGGGVQKVHYVFVCDLLYEMQCHV